MPATNRRTFLLALGGAASVPLSRLLVAADGPAAIDDVLRSGIASRKIPAVVGMAATESGILYSGAFGTRDSSGVPVRADGIFQIASMTKAITSVAAMQLVEQGKVDLAEPVSRLLPQLAHVDVLEGFDAGGKASLRPARTPITLRHLLTHTSGLCYDTWDADMFRYTSQKPAPDTTRLTLMFEPGTRWQYGTGVDWAGRLVETVSGLSLEEYFQRNILQPLGMEDTSYILPKEKFDRMVSSYLREDGVFHQNERQLPAPPTSFNGGGGLYSTAADYVRFMQMILKRGAGPGDRRILQAKTVESMMANQIGELSAGKMKSFRPNRSSDVDIQPGSTEKWGLGFLINTTAYQGGRSAGSLAWAGLLNTFYWIDPQRRVCGVILMQYLPFVDRDAVALLDDFEHAVYRNEATLRRAKR